ncbi:DnaJ C-terminal domain-containing protein [Pyruvatibacter mobilis]|uniref:DnaJ C-terminal domain-containing protein n=1 Tax=Pyruvatibacter mobilis TaxID=1712261 RepID=UPI003BAF7B66
MRDPHQVLGVAKGADAETVKRAYRRLAKQYHPDTAGGDRRAQSRFQEITEAYRALRALADAEERITASAAEATRAYEQPRADAEDDAEPSSGDTSRPGRQPRTKASGTARKEQPARRSSVRADADRPSDEKDTDDKSGRGFFENIRRAGFKPFERRGDDIACTLPLPFLDAAKGGTHRVTLPTGRTVDVTLPAGIEDGKQVRLRGLGAAGSAGGSAGDALVTVDIEPHPYFSREGHDIHLALPISIAEAIEGAKVQVPTVTGRVWVTIPAGSNSGTVLRLTGKGLKKPDETHGNQLIELIVMLPDTPDADLQAFVRRWAGAKSHDPRAAFGLG